jgi:hypothetical protein
MVLEVGHSNAAELPGVPNGPNGQHILNESLNPQNELNRFIIQFFPQQMRERNCTGLRHMPVITLQLMLPKKK